MKIWRLSGIYEYMTKIMIRKKGFNMVIHQKLYNNQSCNDLGVLSKILHLIIKNDSKLQ